MVATRSFPGYATEKEVARQRALLEDALLADGFAYDNLSFKALQFNPPQTLPWVRRNEVSLQITLPADFVPDSALETTQAPEAGD